MGNHSVGTRLGASGERILIISGEATHRARLTARNRTDAIVVATPLDLIAQLEAGESPVSSVVLTGSFARNHHLATFLHEFYPGVWVVDGASDESFLPAFA